MAFDDMTYTPRGVVDRLHVRVLALDRVPLDWRWHAAGVRDSFWRLYRNRAAGGWVRPAGAGRALPLHRGRVYLLPAWAGFDCGADRPFDQLFVHFEVLGWTGATIRSVFDRPIDLGPPGADPGLSAACDAVEAALVARRHGAVGTVLLAKAAVCLALSRTLAGRGLTDPDRKLLSVGPGPVAAAMDYVEAHLAGPLRNDVLARACHMSPSHFIRTFRATVGQTPAQYVTERRVARAAHRLTLTGDPVKQVAADCGFANRYHFSRVFKAVMGVGPAGYRHARGPERRTAPARAGDRRHHRPETGHARVGEIT